MPRRTEHAGVDEDDGCPGRGPREHARPRGVLGCPHAADRAVRCKERAIDGEHPASLRVVDDATRAKPAFCGGTAVPAAWGGAEDSPRER